MIETLGPGTAAAVFAGAALAIAVCGTLMTGLADRLADRLGLGEALAGGILLGVATSLSGIVASVTAAFEGEASVAASNAVGGIAAQTAFLVVADLAYRRVNLEHAAADVMNMLQATLLIFLLALPLAARLAPEVTLWNVHPVTPLLVLIYFAGQRLAFVLRGSPMWQPYWTDETREDVAEEEGPKATRLPVLLLAFGGLGAVVAVAGFLVAESGVALARAFGISGTVVGALGIAVVTSFPELVTTLAAVRRGALQLAVGGIIGGNLFDVLFFAFADAAYRDGSLYHAMEDRDGLMVVSAILITAVLLLGLLMRDRKGIGFEGLGILGIYGVTVAIQIWLG